jgi:CheY-like chemotaxis protein
VLLSLARPSSGIGSPSTPFTILVIDDDALVLSTLTELLRAHGHRALEATKGRDGLELARAERPDLILVDYHMPEMDGLAVVGALKSDAATRDIPTVAFTSGSAAEANQLVRAGCIGFIPKPFEPGTLPEFVAQFLRATVARDRRAPAAPPPPRSRPATAY